LFIFLNIESFITNDLLANNSEPVEVPIRDNLIQINTSTQQNEKTNVSGKKLLVL